MNKSDEHFFIFITIEGIDGTGKSTITKLLADTINAAHIVTPAPRLEKQRKLIEQTNDQNKKFIFYTDSIFQQQEEINNLLKRSHVVCDRYIHSTFAYQWPTEMKFPENIKQSSNKLRNPDFSFLLIADNEERMKRITHREATTGIINKADYDINKINRAQNRFMTMNDLIKIDTSRLTPEEICEKIINKINSTLPSVQFNPPAHNRNQ